MLGGPPANDGLKDDANLFVELVPIVEDGELEEVEGDVTLLRDGSLNNRDKLALDKRDPVVAGIGLRSSECKEAGRG